MREREEKLGKKIAARKGKKVMKGKKIEGRQIRKRMESYGRKENGRN